MLIAQNVHTMWSDRFGGPPSTQHTESRICVKLIFSMEFTSQKYSTITSFAVCRTGFFLLFLCQFSLFNPVSEAEKKKELTTHSCRLRSWDLSFFLFFGVRSEHSQNCCLQSHKHHIYIYIQCVAEYDLGIST